MQPIVIPKTKLKELNTQLTNMQQLYEEICKAESANVPGLEEHKQACLDMQERIRKIKAVYFSNQA